MNFLKPLITEKSLTAVEKFNEYTFKVGKYSTKFDVKRAVEEMFGVKVLSVRSKFQHGKTKKVGKRGIKIHGLGSKKMIVKLAKDNKISLFEIKEEKK